MKKKPYHIRKTKITKTKQLNKSSTNLTQISEKPLTNPNIQTAKSTNTRHPTQLDVSTPKNQYEVTQPRPR